MKRKRLLFALLMRMRMINNPNAILFPPPFKPSPLYHCLSSHHSLCLLMFYNHFGMEIDIWSFSITSALSGAAALTMAAGSTRTTSPYTDTML
jgi:hypothetical protein